jgi:8-oxo-dGTP pyrophosphatase MutT (NUDIX family)
MYYGFVVMEKHIKRIFSLRRKKRLSDKNLKPSAVLIPLFYDGKEFRVLLTRRSNRVQHHKGQISFPGGRPLKKDSSLLETALRESWEETGLKPEDVEIIGELDDTPTRISGFLISPFVALIPYPYKFTRNPRETAEILDFPLSALMNETSFKQEFIENSKDTLPDYTYEYKGNVIWGATARIIKQLLDTLREANLPRQ